MWLTRSGKTISLISQPVEGWQGPGWRFTSSKGNLKQTDREGNPMEWIPLTDHFNEMEAIDLSEHVKKLVLTTYYAHHLGSVLTRWTITIDLGQMTVIVEEESVVDTDP